MNRKYIFVTIFVFVFSFFFLTFGFCAFTSDLTINDVGVTVRQPLDVRVTGLYLNDISSGVVVNNQDYNTKRIMSDIVLPENGFITYKIEFTNYTTCPVYLLQITGLAGNLKYEIDVNRDDKYSLSDLFIEKEYGIRELFVTISYKDNGYNSENEQISLDFGFYFESSYTIVFHSENGMLPFEYQQLEYIETTGTEWINTNYIPNSNTTIELKVASMSNLHTALYCSRTDLLLDTFTAFLISGTDLRVDYGTVQTIIGSYSVGSTHVYRQEQRNISVDGKYVATVPDGSLNGKYNMYLFASHVSEEMIENIGQQRLYYVKIWDNDTLVRDFIPCYRKSDGDVGLYDLVNNEFYFNQGTGSFIKGSEKYIVTRTTQHVLTGQTVKLNSNEFVYDMHVFTGWNTEEDGSGITYKDEQSIYNIAHNNEVINLYAQWRPYQSVVKFDANGGRGVMQNLVTLYGGRQTLPSNTFTSGRYMFIGWNTKPDGSGVNYANNALIDIDVSNGDVELILYAMWSVRYQAVEYIQSTGTQWIDTKYIPNSNTTIELKVAGMTKKHAALYCARTTQTLESFTAFLLYGTDLRVDFGTSQTQIGTYEIGVPYIYKHNKRNVYVNNEFLATVPNEIFNAKYNMYLLASHVSEDVAANIGDTRLYYVKIWDNDTLVRDFIPSYRVSDGEIGLYDLVNDEFYSNKGTGTFIKGNDI